MVMEMGGHEKEPRGTRYLNKIWFGSAVEYLMFDGNKYL